MTTDKKAPGYTAAWNAYIEGLGQVTQRLNELEAELSVATGSMPVRHDELRREFGADRCYRVVRALVQAAAKAYGPSDTTKLEIDEGEVARALDLSERDLGSLRAWRTFDPDRIWREIERRYGEGRGPEIARRQLASMLVQEFRLSKAPPKRVRDRLEVTHSVYSYFSMGVRKLRDDGTVVRVLRALHAIAVWGELPEVAGRLEIAVNGHWRDMEIISRQKIEMGYLSIIPMHEQWTYQLHGELGNRFQEFIAAFGQEALKS